MAGYEKEFGINTYMVYQLKPGPEYHDYRFEGSEALAAAGLIACPLYQTNRMKKGDEKG